MKLNFSKKTIALLLALVVVLAALWFMESRQTGETPSETSGGVVEDAGEALPPLGLEAPDEGDAAEPSDEAKPSGQVSGIHENGEYTSPDDVALYIHTYGRLPVNYVTKSEAKKAGWVSSEGNLADVLPGKSIGGDVFSNYQKLLPTAKGRSWFECDVNYYGGFRGAERLLFSSDGLIFYTDDHYETAEQLY